MSAHCCRCDCPACYARLKNRGCACVFVALALVIMLALGLINIILSIG